MGYHGVEYAFFSQNEKDRDDWYDCFLTICIQKEFMNYFTPGKMLGSGRYAKVF